MGLSSTIIYPSELILCSTIIWRMAAFLRNSTVVVVVRTRPRAIPLAMINMRKSTHGFPFLSYEYGASLARPSGRRRSAIIYKDIWKDGEFSKWLLSLCYQKTFQEFVFKAVKNRKRRGLLIANRSDRLTEVCFFLQDKVALFETMMTTMNEANRDKTKVPD